MTSLENSEPRRASRRESEKRSHAAHETSNEPTLPVDSSNQRRSQRKKPEASDTIEATKTASPAVAKDVDIPPSPASKRAHHPDPLRPEQVQELGITGVSKGDCVFLVDKILDERTRNGKLQYLIKWKGFSAKYNTWEPASNILTPELLEEYKVGRRSSGETETSAKEAVDAPKRGAKNGSSVASELLEQTRGNRRKRKNSVSSTSQRDTEDTAGNQSKAVKIETGLEDKKVKIEDNAEEISFSKPGTSPSPAAAGASASQFHDDIVLTPAPPLQLLHTVAEVAEFRFVEQGINETPLVLNGGPPSPELMEDLASEDEGDGSGGEDSEYSTVGGASESRRRKSSESNWARKGYKDWDDKEEELLLSALKKYGPRFFDEDKLAEAGLGHRPPNAVRAKYRRMWMAGRAPKPKNVDSSTPLSTTASTSAPFSKRVNPSPPAAALPTFNAKLNKPQSQQQFPARALPQQPVASRPTQLPAIAPAILSPPEPLQPPLIYSSGPLATHPSNPLVARFMTPAVMHASMPRVPQLLPRNQGVTPAPTVPVPNPPRTTAPLKGALACDGCRYMHVRCNGAQPCDQCIRRRLQCSFVNGGKRKGTTPSPAMLKQRAMTDLHKLSDPIKNPPPGYVIGPDGAAWPQQTLRNAVAATGPSSLSVTATAASSAPAIVPPLPSHLGVIAPPPPPPTQPHRPPQLIAPRPPLIPTPALPHDPGSAPGSLLSRVSIQHVTSSHSSLPTAPLFRHPFMATPSHLLPPLHSFQPPSIPSPKLALPSPPTVVLQSASEQQQRPVFPQKESSETAKHRPILQDRERDSQLQLHREAQHAESQPISPPVVASAKSPLTPDDLRPDARNTESVLAVVNKHWHQLNRINWCRQHKDVAPVYASVADMVLRGPGAELDVGAVYFTLEEWRNVSRALLKFGFALRGRTIMVTTSVIEIFSILREAFSKQR